MQSQDLAASAVRDTSGAKAASGVRDASAAITGNAPKGASARRDGTAAGIVTRVVVDAIGRVNVEGIGRDMPPVVTRAVIGASMAVQSQGQVAETR
jgi:hypothetical protein